MKHTPGKLAFTESEYEPNRFTIGADGKWLMSILHNGEPLVERQRENMRRLAACWNACDGVATSAIDLEPKIMMMDLVNAAVQRDELLAALKVLLPIAANAYGALTKDLDQARAAIAKTEADL